MSDSLKAASMAAGLTEAEKREVNALIKAVAVNKQLNNLPADVANKVFINKPYSQQQALVQMLTSYKIASSCLTIWLLSQSKR